MNEWKIACDRPGCTDWIAARGSTTLAELFAHAEDRGWQIEPAIAPLRHFCPAHHVAAHDLERPAAVGIRRSP